LERKIQQYQPAFIAILGIETYRRAFGKRQATLGRQPETLGGSTLWVLPNPSGLNAHYQLADLARLYGELRLAVEG
jgi:TDG/mug DNA glycosylase family protein